MSRKVTYLPLFDCDVLDGVTYLEARVRGLGSEFAKAVAREIDAILANPLAFPVTQGEIRRTVIRRFRYVIFYCVRARDILMIGVVHGAKDLDRWLSARLERE